MSEKILLDTDIGTDIDDAFCLAYLLAKSECDLLGVTTVGMEAEKRAALVSAICRHAGRSVPIASGSSAPMCPTRYWYGHHPRQVESLDRWPHQSKFPKHTAVEFMRETIRAHPGEVNLLAIGPMTNLGLLFATDPDIGGLLKRVVLMCGSIQRSRQECNAMLDPWATDIVYRAQVSERRTVPLEVTCQVRMPADEVRRQFQTPLLKPILDMAEVHFRKCSHITFHDPLAAATIFVPEICGYKRGNLTVELASEAVRGMTHWKEDREGGKDQLALEVSAERFFETYFGALKAE